MIYTTAAAYKHSFSPRATGQYVIDLVEAGWDPRRAIQQALIEHGQQQAEEFAAACRAHLGQRGDRKSVKAWLNVAIKALASLD